MFEAKRLKNRPAQPVGRTSLRLFPLGAPSALNFRCRFFPFWTTHKPHYYTSLDSCDSDKPNRRYELIGRKLRTILATA